MIRGTTSIIAHFGDPIAPVKAPMIYNPWFEKRGVDAVVVPMGVTTADYAAVLSGVFRLLNIRGALVTMPHKVSTVDHLAEASVAVQIAGSCNAVVRRADGTLAGDLFDGAGFTRAARARGVAIAGRSALVVGTGGVGRAIAAALAAEGAARLRLYDLDVASAAALAVRIARHYPQIAIETGTRDPAGMDIVVNATPLGMRADDPLPIDVDRLAASTFVGEVVMKEQLTPLLKAARARGCATQAGTDMLFEQIPLYLEYFGFPAATAAELRAVARLDGMPGDNPAS
ncbi:MAG: shikimate dehydrogenase family protein [Burkholderiales bacterium]|jgi:shikimate dehydrogenase